jgi:4-hydroxy-2-oxoheptanedioate aldolase
VPATTAAGSLASRLRAGETLFTAWSALPEPLAVEALARAGFDAVTLDMQHGFHSTESVLRGVGAALFGGAPAIVRVPVGGFDMASRALDFGAGAVIAPMINSAADARAFAAACKFPPAGERSWGPHRAIALLGGPDQNTYLATANADTLAFAMIETRAAFDALDAILEVEGIDGVFVGPSDFSIAWSEGRTVNAKLADMMPTVAGIAATAKRAGRLAAIFCVDPAMAGAYRDMGFGLMALGTDTIWLQTGAGAVLRQARECARPT